MNDVKFVDYKATPGEKHVGIITIQANGINLRYKMVPGKNGGTYPNAPSYKVTEFGQDSYISAIIPESAMLDEKIKECIKSNMARIMSQSNSVTQNPFKSSEPTYRPDDVQVEIPF